MPPVLLCDPLGLAVKTIRPALRRDTLSNRYDDAPWLCRMLD